MAVTIKAAANRIYQEFRTDFFKELDAAPRVWPEYAMEVPSSSKSTLHAWLANQHGVREWIGPRQAKSMGSRTWEVTNKKFELTYEFERDQIDDDLSGLVAAAVMSARQQGEKWARHEDLLVAQVLEAGVSTNCWDGQYFFDTDHPIDVDGISTSSTFDNDRALALSHANYDTVRTAFLGFKNVDNTPMVMPQGMVLLVPPALETKARQIVQDPYGTPAVAYGLVATTGASPNPFAGSARVVVNQYLTSDTRWYLLAGGMMKPIMLQRRRPLELDDSGGPGSDLWWKEEKIEIGGSARYNASYTLPQLAITSAP